MECHYSQMWGMPVASALGRGRQKDSRIGGQIQLHRKLQVRPGCMTACFNKTNIKENIIGFWQQWESPFIRGHARGM